MKISLKKIIKIITNPLLCYSVRPEGFVFRNYSLTKDTGYYYDKIIAKNDVGKALEYRIRLDKILKRTAIFSLVVLYVLFCPHKITLFSILLFEFLFLSIVGFARIICSYKYSNYLNRFFGKYKVIEFSPPITNAKSKEFFNAFQAKISLGMIMVAIFFIPSTIFPIIIKQALKPQHEKPKLALNLSKFYSHIYPVNEKNLDMQAYSKFLLKDYQGSLDLYKKAIDFSGKKLTEKDINRFGNILFLQNIISGAHDAIDLFNEYATKKSMTKLQEEKMLWIKSAFKIKNSIYTEIISDYDNLLESIDNKDITNSFYISCDKAYMMFLSREYSLAVNNYNELITFAQDNIDLFGDSLPNLYAERGWVKYEMQDFDGANKDFELSKLKKEDLEASRPSFSAQNNLIKNF